MYRLRRALVAFAVPFAQLFVVFGAAPPFPAPVSYGGVSMTGIASKTVSGVKTYKYFVFGEYIDNTTINSTSQATTINTARGQLYLESMRPFINAALATW